KKCKKGKKGRQDAFTRGCKEDSMKRTTGIKPQNIKSRIQSDGKRSKRGRFSSRCRSRSRSHGRRRRTSKKRSSKRSRKGRSSSRCRSRCSKRSTKGRSSARCRSRSRSRSRFGRRVKTSKRRRSKRSTKGRSSVRCRSRSRSRSRSRGRRRMISKRRCSGKYGKNVNPFFNFLKTFREKYKGTGSRASVIAKKGAEMWKSMSCEQKLEYIRQACEAQKKYGAKIRTWDLSRGQDSNPRFHLDDGSVASARAAASTGIP
ncbi:hypothetical protein L9F63_016303, partial [Diploptera punctata]